MESYVDMFTFVGTGTPSKVKKVKSAFQKELDAKLRERRKRGLCVDWEEDEEEELKVDQIPELTVNSLVEDFEPSDLEKESLESNQKHKINVDSRYMQLLDELVNGDDIDESPTSPIRPYADDSEEENSEAETVVQLSPPVPLPRRKLLDDMINRTVKDTSIILDRKNTLTQEMQDENRLFLFEDIKSVITSISIEDSPIPKISKDISKISNISNFSDNSGSMQYFYSSLQSEKPVEKKSIAIIKAASLLDSLNCNSLPVEKNSEDNLNVESVRKELDDLDLFSNNAISTSHESVSMEDINEKLKPCNVDQDNNVVLVSETQNIEKSDDFKMCNQNIEKLVDFGTFDDFNGNMFTIEELTERHMGEIEKKNIDQILSFEESENKTLESSLPLNGIPLPLPNNTAKNKSMLDTSVDQKTSKNVESKKVNSDSKNLLSPRTNAGNSNTKTLQKKRQTGNSPKSTELLLQKQIASPEKLETKTKKLDSPLKTESVISKTFEGVSRKEAPLSPKISELNKKRVEDLVKRLATFSKKQDVQSINCEVPKNQDIQPNYEVPKKKNGFSQRTQSPSDRNQSPKAHNLNNLFTKVHTSRIQEEIKTSATRRVRSAGRERQIHISPKTQTSAISSPAGKDSPDSANAAAIRKAVFDEWCRRKMQEKKKLLKQQQKEKELQERKKKAIEEEEKRLESEQTFIAWKKHKEGYLKKKNHVKKLEESAKIIEEVERRKDAEMAMQSWKKMKDGKIVKDKKELKKHEIDKIKLEKEEKERDKQDAQSAFEAWKAQKDAELKKKIEEKRKHEDDEVRKQNEKIQKELEAIRAYEEWLDHKDKMKRKGRKSYNNLQDSPTWSPPGKTLLVTHGRQKRCVS